MVLFNPARGDGGGALQPLQIGETAGRRDSIVPLAALSVALIGLLHSTVDFSLQESGYAIVAFAVVGVGLGQSFRTSKDHIGVR
jgi:hypothetical protein